MPGTDPSQAAASDRHDLDSIPASESVIVNSKNVLENLDSGIVGSDCDSCSTQITIPSQELYHLEDKPEQWTKEVVLLKLWPFGELRLQLEQKSASTVDIQARFEGTKQEERKKKAEKNAGQLVCSKPKVGFMKIGLQSICAMGMSPVGSQGLIGWLRTRGAHGTVDVTNFFDRTLERVCTGDDTLPTDYAYLFVPGYLWRWIPTGGYFSESVAAFNACGLESYFADQVESEGTVLGNARILKNLVLRLHNFTGKRVVLIGHSKGGVDSLAAVAKYRSQLAPLVRGIVCLQSPIGGSPVASDLVFGNKALMRVVRNIYSIVGSDFESLKDLTYSSRQQYFNDWGQHWPVQTVPVLCFSSKIGQTHKTMASRLMSLTGMYIGKMYGHGSDGAVTQEDAELPGTMVVRVTASLSHMSTVIPSPKEGITVGDTCAKAWQINKAAVITMLSQSSTDPMSTSSLAGALASWWQGDSGLVQSATTDDMNKYKLPSATGQSLRKSRSHESLCSDTVTQFRAMPQRPNIQRPAGPSEADKAAKRYHLSKCTSDLSDVFAMAHSSSHTEAPLPPPRDAGSRDTSIPKARKLTRSNTMSAVCAKKSLRECEQIPEQEPVCDRWLSAEPWWKECVSGSMDTEEAWDIWDADYEKWSAASVQAASEASVLVQDLHDMQEGNPPCDAQEEKNKENGTCVEHDCDLPATKSSSWELSRLASSGFAGVASGVAGMMLMGGFWGIKKHSDVSD